MSNDRFNDLIYRLYMYKIPISTIMKRTKLTEDDIIEIIIQKKITNEIHHLKQEIQKLNRKLDELMKL